MKRVNGTTEFYSQTIGNNGCELFLAKNGQGTTTYPHVHIIHHGNGNVEIIASESKSDKRWRKQFQNFPSGQEVDAAIREAQQHLSR